MSRSLALTAAGMLLYVPSNLFPIATLPIGFASVSYTVLVGVIDLVQAKFLALALLVFVASFAIPVLKLVGLSWCMWSVWTKSKRFLRTKTRVYRVVEEIGRWSMVDPFVIACFVPVTQYNSLIYGRVESGAQIFATVVVLTIVAAKCFDPRMMWDRA